MSAGARRPGVAAIVALGAVATAALLAPTAAYAQNEGSIAQDGIYDRPFIGSLGSTAIGGYVEGNTNYFLEDGVGDGFGMELRRFNIFLFSSLGERIRFLSELEFEHGTEEIALETALLDFRVNPGLTLRGGVLLPPIGYLNQNHDSPQWNFVERPLVTTEIIPSTLSEVGFGVLGRLYPSWGVVSYDLYLTNGLQEGVVGNDRGRTFLGGGKSDAAFAEDNNGSPAVSGRAGVAFGGGFEVGASFYTGYYNRFRIEGEQVDEKRRLSIYSLDARGAVGPLELRGEAALATIDVPEGLSELFGDRQWGGHLDATLPVWRPTILGQESPSLLALDLRAEYVDLNVGTFESTGRDIRDETTALVPGISFRPTPDIVLRANYRREWIRDFLGNPTAIRAGYQVGVAAYF